MFRPLIATALILALAACTNPYSGMTPEEAAAKKARIAKADAAVANASNVQVGGKTFSVAPADDRSFAFVDLVGPAGPYTAPEVEAAARASTGCKATFNAGVLALIGGDVRKADLGALRQKISGKFNGWGVTLAC